MSGAGRKVRPFLFGHHDQANTARESNTGPSTQTRFIVILIGEIRDKETMKAAASNSKKR